MFMPRLAQAVANMRAKGMIEEVEVLETNYYAAHHNQKVPAAKAMETAALNHEYEFPISERLKDEDPVLWDLINTHS